GDDYVVKPFSVRELLARVEAVLRRAEERPSDVAAVPFPGGTADLTRREVRFGDGAPAIPLTENEAALLRYLSQRPGRPVSRDELLQRVWRVSASAGETRTVDMQIARLREKLRDAGASPRLLVTVRGKGYMWGQG
ncbi:MAG: response regulator transcription factor, partial [Planctomycetes bacterium]|nr:response regulator transcription factor [Planctomycetota bacterium]